MRETDSFSIIIPAFNEERQLRKTVFEVLGVFTALDQAYEIILVNDGSTDRTAREADALSHEIPEVNAYHLSRNHGKGFAIREGVRHATGTYVVFMDADLDIHPKQFNRIMSSFDNNTCDVAIGSKRHPESRVNYPFHRKVISTVYYWIISLLFGLRIKDTQAGLKIYKKKVLREILPLLIVKKFAFDLEMLVTASNSGYRIVEFPIQVDFSREFGRICSRDCWRTGLDTLAIFYRHSILNYYNYPVTETDSSPKVSIIIPLGHPTENLDRCLDACLKLNYPDFEIIVLPDNPFTTPYDSADSQAPLIIIPTENVTPSEKRNIGAERATGTILAFLDDDAFPQFDWLRVGVSNMAQEGIAAVGGPAVTPVNSNYWEQIGGEVYASPIVSGNYRYRFTPGKYQEVDDCPSCNFFMHKNIFFEIGGFSSQYWPGEDTLLCREIASQSKGKIVYDPHLIVEHRRRPLFYKHLLQLSRYALHRGYFIKKWPENSLKLSYFLPSLLFVATVLGGGIALFSPTFRLIYLSCISLYLILCLFFSLRPNLLKAFWVCCGTIATHFTYGIYFLKGFFAKEMPEVRRLTSHGTVSASCGEKRI